MNKYQDKINLFGGYYLDNFDPKNISLENIIKIQYEIGCELPNDYLEFLINYGGFAFNGYVIYPLLASCPVGNEQIVDIFFGVLPNDSYDLIKNYRCYKDRLPPNFLPIAQNPMGDLTCLSLFTLYGRQKGSVYFWQHDAHDVVDDNGNTIETERIDTFLAAHSFDEFVESLKRDEEEDKEDEKYEHEENNDE